MRIDILEKRYGQKTVLKDIHLQFHEGETTMIIGTSGAGKSTLIKCLIQQTKFDGTVEGYNASDIAYIPQHPTLNRHETAFDAIYWSSRFADLFARKDDLLLKTNDHVNKIGLSEVKNKQINKLSGGQVQRVSIAKELIRKKNIIVADEIDTGLDCGVAHKLIFDLSEITHHDKLTTIVISHNLINVDLFDKIIVLAKSSSGTGKIAFAGTPSEAKCHFETQNYVDILKKINSQDEGGEGIADTYIEKFQSLLYHD